MSDWKQLAEILTCPKCHQTFACGENSLKCSGCSSEYKRNTYGYLELTPTATLPESTTQEYIEVQGHSGARVYAEYLKPLLLSEPFRRVLDAGCGLGQGISMLLDEGYDAYGVDIPILSKFWAQARKSSDHFLCCDITALPFPDNFFDVVYSLGVIEHIGTKIGHCTLADDYWNARQAYANELLRVTRPGGRLIIACPNKSFPIDIQHGVDDGLNPAHFLRQYIFRTTRMNIHRTWGKYHLLSYSETKRLFSHKGQALQFQALPLKGYFGFSQLQKGFLRAFFALAVAYVNHLPKLLRTTFLNPYMLVMITKSGSKPVH